METAANLIERIVDELGGLTKATEALGLTNPSIIANWRTRGRVPYKRVLDVESVTGIPRHEIRPDIYPSPAEVA